MKCEFCFSKRLKLKYTVKSEITTKFVEYYRCSDCGSVSQYPYPDPEVIRKYYESYIDIKKLMNPGYLDDKQYISLKCERDKTFSEINFPLSSIRDRRNVELGCANGHFLKYLIENGSYDTVGIDISDALLSSVKLNSVRLINGSLKNIADGEVDNLFMFNVIEHIDDLGTTFENILRITHEESNIIIETPITGFISGLHGSKWRFLMPDEHLNIPSMRGFSKLFSSYNLKIAGFTRFGSGFTSGSIPKILKTNFDLLVKKFMIGDRGSFLLKRK